MASLFAALIAVLFPIFNTLAIFQNTSSYTTTVVSTSVVLALDVSNGMAGRALLREKEAVQVFTDTLDSTVPVAVVAYASQARIVQDYTTDRAALKASIDALRPAGALALYDGSVKAVGLAATSPAQHRLVVLLSHTGEYTRLSTATRQDASTLAKARQVAVFTIALSPVADRAYLTELAAATNGSSYDVESFEALTVAYDTIGRQIAASDNLTVVSNNPGTKTSAIIGKQFAANKAGSGKTSRLPDRQSNNQGPTSLVYQPKDNPALQAKGVVNLSSFVVAIDVSNTMGGKPLLQTKEALKLFIETLDKNTPVAIVAYGSHATLVQDYTVDKTLLTAALDNLKTDGSLALYDGALTAVNLAAGSLAQNRMVVFINHGVEGRQLSKATRHGAAALASSRGVSVITIALGSQADRAYLKELVKASHGQSYDVPTVDQLTAVLDSLSAQFFSVSIPPSSAGIAKSDTLLPLVAASSGAATSQITATIINLDNLPPLAGNSNAPKISQRSADTVIPVGSNPPIQAASDASGNSPSSGLDTAPQPSGNMVPITIAVPPDSAFTSAELAVNDATLATFDQPPYQYDFEVSALRPGTYSLSFKVVNSQGVASQSSLDFEVLVPAANPTTNQPGPSRRAKNNPDLRDNPSSVEAGSPAVGPDTPIQGPAQRVLLIDGKAQPFRLSFSPDHGLRVITAAPQPVTTQTLGDILTRPASLLPEPVRNAVTAQHPTLWTIVILLMMVTLLPQSLFTLYWMTYSWNNPAVAEQFRSPKDYVAPQHSFTALLPARHEESVIKDTIKAIDRIDYPDHLKEILVLCRTDDVGTIEKAKEAVAELGKDNIRVVTFSSGPINKPHGLNIGLQEASKEVIAVFDAEDEPHPDLYNVINTVMIRDGADVVQSGVQLINFKSTWFSALNCLEYFFWFKSGLHCFTRSLKVTPLGGNTVFFKKPWLQKLGGWDEKCLTEDADLGIRLTQLGAKIQIVYDEKHATQEETPHNVDSFIKQRTRWCQGFYEVFFKGDWAKLPSLKQKVVAIYILLNSLFQAGIVLYLPVGLYIALTQRISIPVSLLSYIPIFLSLLQLITNLVGIREFTAAYDLKLPFLFRIKMALYYYPYQLLLSAAAFRAIGRFIGRSSAWEKTAHSNLHRQAPVLEPGV